MLLPRTPVQMALSFFYFLLCSCLIFMLLSAAQAQVMSVAAGADLGAGVSVSISVLTLNLTQNVSQTSILSPSLCCFSESLPSLSDSIFASSSPPSFSVSILFNISSLSPNWTAVQQNIANANISNPNCQLNLSLSDSSFLADQTALLLTSSFSVAHNGLPIAVSATNAPAVQTLASTILTTANTSVAAVCDNVTVNYASTVSVLTEWNAIPLSSGVNVLTIHQSSSVFSYVLALIQPTADYPLPADVSLPIPPVKALNFFVSVVNVSLNWSVQRAVNYNDDSAYLYSLQTDFSNALNVSVSRIYVTSAKFTQNVSVSLLLGVIDNVTDVVAAAAAATHNSSVHSSSSAKSALLMTQDYAQMLLNYFSGIAVRPNVPIWMQEVVSITKPPASAATAMVILNRCPDEINFYQNPPAAASLSSYCSVVTTATTTNSPSSSSAPTTSTASTAPFSSSSNSTLYLAIPIGIGVVLCVLILLCVCYQVNYEREKQRKELEGAVTTLQQSQLKQTFRSATAGGSAVGVSGAVHEAETPTLRFPNPFHSTLVHTDSMRKTGKPRGKDKQGFAIQADVDVDDEFFLESARGTGNDSERNSSHSQFAQPNVSLTRQDSSSASSSSAVSSVGAKKFALRGMTMTQMEERRTQLMDLEIARDAQRKLWKGTETNTVDTAQSSKAKGKGKGKIKTSAKGKKQSSAVKEEEDTTGADGDDDSEQWVNVRVEADTANELHRKKTKGKGKQRTAADSEFVELTVRGGGKKKQADAALSAVGAAALAAGKPKPNIKTDPFPGADDDGIVHMSWTDESSQLTSNRSAASTDTYTPTRSGTAVTSNRSAPSKFYAADDAETEEDRDEHEAEQADEQEEALKKPVRKEKRTAQKPVKDSTDENAELP